MGVIGNFGTLWGNLGGGPWEDKGELTLIWGINLLGFPGGLFKPPNQREIWESLFITGFRLKSVHTIFGAPSKRGDPL